MEDAEKIIKFTEKKRFNSCIFRLRALCASVVKAFSRKASFICNLTLIIHAFDRIGEFIFCDLILHPQTDLIESMLSSSRFRIDSA